MGAVFFPLGGGTMGGGFTPCRRSRKNLRKALVARAGGETRLERECFAMARGEEGCQLVQDEHLRGDLLAIMEEFCGGGKDIAEVPEGQPFRLELMRALLEKAGDGDYSFLEEAKVGLPLGVKFGLPTTPASFERQVEWALDDVSSEECLLAKGNYPSARLHEEHLRAHLEEEVSEGLVEKMTRQEFEMRYGSDRAIAALAVLVEDEVTGKKRVIHDASHGVRVNNRIRCQDKLRMPGGREKRYLLSMFQRAKSTVFSVIGDFGKAHRRFKYREEERGFLGCVVRDDDDVVYVNKVGTFGVTSTPYWWGRISGSLIRLAHYLLGPDVPIELLLYADDLETMGITPEGRKGIVATFAYLAALGSPFKWKKQRGGLCTEWIGLTTDYSSFSFGLPEKRALWLSDWISSLCRSKEVEPREFAAVLGRLGFSTTALPWEKPFLGPLYVWSAAVRAQKKRVTVPWAILMILDWISGRMKGDGRMEVVKPESDDDPGGVTFFTDARASDEDARIGGGSPKRVIAALELLATLVAVKLWGRGASGNIKGKMRAYTDNKGNSFALCKGMSTKFPLTILLIELAEELRQQDRRMDLEWVKRDENVEADDLSNGRWEDFDLANRVDFRGDCKDWIILDKVQARGEELYKEIQALKEQRRKSNAEGCGSTQRRRPRQKAEIQHLASATWALAKLHGTKQATGRTVVFLRSLADFLRKARVNKRSDSPWRVRFDGLFLSHISILCWSFARVMVKERVTRQLLRSASMQLDTFTDEGAIKAQEHANLLWAYAEACEKTWAGMQKPYAVLKRLVNLLCDPKLGIQSRGLTMSWMPNSPPRKLRLQGENATSFAAAVKALARLPIGASPQVQHGWEARQWMQAASVRQSKRAGLAELPPGEVVAMVRSLASCRSLHQRMMTTSLQFLQEDSRYQELQPAQLQMLLDALALLRPRKLAQEHLRPIASMSPCSTPSILVTTMPPWEAPSNLKLICSSEWQSQAQVAQIVQMLQRQMQMQQTQHPEVQKVQKVQVVGPSDATGNRAKVKQVEPMVTVAVKNIPLHYSQDMFMDQVKKHGFEGLFDLLYLSWSSKSGTNKGVGFVNFIRPDHAQRFQKEMEGKYFDEEHIQSGLPIQVERADVQGLRSNRARFTNKDSDFGPWLSPTKHKVVQGRLNDFPLPLLTSTLSRLQLLEGTEDVLIAASKRFEDAELRLPKQWWKGGQKEHGEDGAELSLWQWVRLVNSVEPMPCSAGSAPWTSEKLAKPFAAWLSGFLEDFNLETELLSAVLEEREEGHEEPGMELLQESAVARYRARLLALDSLGPRFTPFVAQLGLNFEANPPSDLQAKVLQREEPAALEARLRFLPHDLPGAGGEQMAVLQHFAVANDESGGRSAEPRGRGGRGAESGEESEEELEGEDSSEQVLLKRGVLLAASDAASKHADFKVLSRLIQDLLERDKDGDVSGDVTICTDKAPSLSSLGAMKQFCHQWPKISLHVSYTGLEQSWLKEMSSLLSVADPQGANASADGAAPALALEEAVRRALSGRPKGQTVALLGTDPRETRQDEGIKVRELWKSVCATGVRPSGKNVPGKKREWQDKLKYFLAHRPHAFRLDDGEKLTVRLVENREEEQLQL
eukprot:s1206_g14.t1